MIATRCDNPPEEILSQSQCLNLSPSCLQLDLF